MTFFEQMNTLYKSRLIFKSGLKRAVADGILTAAEYVLITGEEYNG